QVDQVGPGGDERAVHECVDRPSTQQCRGGQTGGADPDHLDQARGDPSSGQGTEVPAQATFLPVSGQVVVGTEPCRTRSGQRCRRTSAWTKARDEHPGHAHADAQRRSLPQRNSAPAEIEAFPFPPAAVTAGGQTGEKGGGSTGGHHPQRGSGQALHQPARGGCVHHSPSGTVRRASSSRPLPSGSSTSPCSSSSSGAPLSCVLGSGSGRNPRVSSPIP